MPPRSLRFRGAQSRRKHRHAESQQKQNKRHMKRMHYLTNGAAGACFLAAFLALPAAAADADSPWYWKVEAGANWAKDSDLDIGFRTDAGVGYKFHKYIAGELETGFIYNGIDGVDGSLSHIPVLVNAVFRYDNSSKFVPYAGAGVGGAYSILSIDDGGIDDDDGDIVFAWQLFGGVRYNINDRTSVGIYYKYLGTGDSSFSISGFGTAQANDVQNHTFGLNFTMKF
jgi:opacity protein-like surface antigen